MRPVGRRTAGQESVCLTLTRWSKPPEWASNQPTARTLEIKKPMGGCLMDVLNVELHDTEQMTEIGLVADLMVVASASIRPLEQCAIDVVLGVQPA